jgi:hypothetical protein
MLIESVVSANSFVQLLVAGGAGMVAFILVAVPIGQLRQFAARVARGRLRREEI